MPRPINMKKDTIQQRNRKLAASNSCRSSTNSSINSTTTTTSPTTTCQQQQHLKQHKKEIKYQIHNSAMHSGIAGIHSKYNDFAAFDQFDAQNCGVGSNFLPQHVGNMLSVNESMTLPPPTMATAQSINVHHFHHVAPVHDATAALLFEKSVTMPFDKTPWSAFSTSGNGDANNNNNGSLLGNPVNNNNHYANSNYANAAYGQWPFLTSATSTTHTSVDSLKDKKNLSNEFF